MKFPGACVEIIRNHDNMYQINKGIIGIRMDGIENAVIDNISISNLYNKADNEYNQLQENNIFDINVRGISIIDGDLLMFGYNVIDNLVSWYGVATGLDTMDDISHIDCDENSRLEVTNLVSKSQLLSESVDQSLMKIYIIVGIIGVVVLICFICICTRIKRKF